MIGEWQKGDRVRARRAIYRAGVRLIDEGEIGTVTAIPERGEPSSLLARVRFDASDDSGHVLVGWSILDGIDSLIGDLERIEGAEKIELNPVPKGWR